MRHLRLFLGLPICVAVGFLHIGALAVHADSGTNLNGSQVDWYVAGVGISSNGAAKGISYSYITEAGLVSLRYVSNVSELKGNSRILSESIWDAGVLYGTTARTSFGLASISGGIGAVGGFRAQYPTRTSYGNVTLPYSESDEEERFLTVGIPVAGQIFWTPSPVVGIGIYGYANVNPEASFVGALLGIQLGSLR